MYLHCGVGRITGTMNGTNLVLANSSQLEGLGARYQKSSLINTIADWLIGKLSFRRQRRKNNAYALFKQIVVVVNCENFIVKGDTPMMYLPERAHVLAH